MRFSRRHRLWWVSVSVAGLSLATGCKSTGNGSQVKDSVWASGQNNGAAGYASIVQSQTPGSYKTYFFSQNIKGVSVCFADEQTCKADPSKAVVMTSTQTTDGQPAWRTTAPTPLSEGSFLTFYVTGHTDGIVYKVQRSPNGQLDPVALDSSTASTSFIPAGSVPAKTTVPQVAADPWVPNPDHVAITDVEASIIRETNIARQQTDPRLRLLVVRQDLMNIARQTAAYNARYNTPNRHSGANTYENVYYAMPNAQATVFGNAMGPGWLTHPGHRENLLNPNTTGIGAAMYRAADGTPQWVEDML